MIVPENINFRDWIPTHLPNTTSDVLYTLASHTLAAAEIGSLFANNENTSSTNHLKSASNATQSMLSFDKSTEFSFNAQNNVTQWPTVVTQNSTYLVDNFLTIGQNLSSVLLSNATTIASLPSFRSSRKLLPSGHNILKIDKNHTLPAFTNIVNTLSPTIKKSNNNGFIHQDMKSLLKSQSNPVPYYLIPHRNNSLTKPLPTKRIPINSHEYLFNNHHPNINSPTKPSRHLASSMPRSKPRGSVQYGSVLHRHPEYHNAPDLVSNTRNATMFTRTAPPYIFDSPYVRWTLIVLFSLVFVTGLLGK